MYNYMSINTYTYNNILINYSYKCNNIYIRTGVIIQYHILFITYKWNFLVNF